MKAGETGVLAALVVFLAGGLFVGLSKMPEQELFFRTLNRKRNYPFTNS